jgi:uncharacterized protein YdiU (UPF0061 family)
MCAKLGFESYAADVHGALIDDLLGLLESAETDMTLFFRQLAKVNVADAEGLDDAELCAPLGETYYKPESLGQTHRERTAAWLRRYANALSQAGVLEDARQQRMNQTNPKYVLRNYLAQLAIDAAEQGDFSVIEELLDVLRHPYDEQPEKQRFAAKRPEWARHRAGCSMLSCSS